MLIGSGSIIYITAEYLPLSVSTSIIPIEGVKIIELYFNLRSISNHLEIARIHIILILGFAPFISFDLTYTTQKIQFDYH